MEFSKKLEQRLEQSRMEEQQRREEVIKAHDEAVRHRLKIERQRNNVPVIASLIRSYAQQVSAHLNINDKTFNKVTRSEDRTLVTSRGNIWQLGRKTTETVVTPIAVREPLWALDSMPYKVGEVKESSVRGPATVFAFKGLALDSNGQILRYATETWSRSGYSDLPDRSSPKNLEVIDTRLATNNDLIPVGKSPEHYVAGQECHALDQWQIRLLGLIK